MASVNMVNIGMFSLPVFKRLISHNFVLLKGLRIPGELSC